MCLNFKEQPLKMRKREMLLWGHTGKETESDQHIFKFVWNDVDSKLLPVNVYSWSHWFKCVTDCSLCEGQVIHDEFIFHPLVYIVAKTVSSPSSEV